VADDAAPLAARQQPARQEAAVLRSGCRSVAPAECRLAADHQHVRLVEMEAALRSPAEQRWASAAASSLLTAASVPAAERSACRSARSRARLAARLMPLADARAVRLLRLAAAPADAAARRPEAVAVPQQVAAAWDAWAPQEVAAGQAVSAAAGQQPAAVAQDAVVPQRVAAVVAARDAAVPQRVVVAVASAEAVQPAAALVAEPAAVGLRLAVPGVAGQHQAVAPLALPSAWAFRPGRLRREGPRPGQRRTARSAHEKSSLQGASPKGRSWQAARDEG
jgi:hypothetical protein